MSLDRKFFFTLLFITISAAAFGQAARTPFSTFGIGEPYGNALIQNHGMGGTGVSQPLYWSVNNQNPALLVFNYYTVFQTGALLESRTIGNDTISQKSVNGNLTYLVTAFPAMRSKKRPHLMTWSTSVGLMPFTDVNYKIGYQDRVIDNVSGLPLDTIAVLEQGSGGLSQFYWANGIRLHKYISVGIKATYLFGSITNDYANALLGSTQTLPFIVGIQEQTYVKDFMFTGGFSFSKDSIGRKNDYRASFGIVSNFLTDLKATKTTLIERRFSTGDPLTSDTLVTTGGNISIPQTLTIGASLSKGSQWSVAGEFFVQDWSKFKSISQEDESNLEKSWRASLGGEFTPNTNAFDNYFKRITYRVGLSYEKTPFIDTNDKQLKDIGINFGFSLPAGRSSLDWAFRMGKRGDKSENVLEETYFKVYFGITFNDQWFIRRRFD
jgi:hypothetical protein